ncbi:MAG TPA: hypothetical protein VL403_06920 [Candidatus Kryptonia bacterium]|nr:hypothetical protein [Candidatus Kryptonia bacterium]
MRVGSQWTRVLLSTLVACVAAACHRPPSRPDVQFAPFGDGYASKMDFAKIEHLMPLSRADRDKLTPENLKSLAQEEIDQIYARLTAGPIPDGPFDGGVYFAKGTGLDVIAKQVGGLKGDLIEIKADLLQHLAEALWQGKVFYRDQRVLRNRIEDTALLTPLLGGNLLDLKNIPKIDVKGQQAWLLFPAKLYCGQSLLDSRRESIIIDYAFTDDVEGYRDMPDKLAGRNGFQVRDEIRMVRPGFYLGRAYLGRVFVLNFTLYNDDIAKRDGPSFDQNSAIAEDCWTGTQLMVAADR